VIIDTQTGADFVFDDSYNLPRLNELEAFVKQYKHLPGIEPESKMQSDGVNLGDMQTKLLQKVEELTLLLIEQNKLIKAQEERIKNLEVKN
jgi:hypothetical protein